MDHEGLTPFILKIPFGTGFCLYTLYVSESANIEIIDFSGRLIEKRKVQEGKTSLNLSSNSRGIYYVRIKTKETVKTIKVIRE